MITKETINHLAILSRLEFSETELNKFTTDLDAIFSYASLLQKIDTSNINPSAHSLAMQNVFREDTVSQYANTQKILDNAPLKEESSFVVPKILAD